METIRPLTVPKTWTDSGDTIGPIERTVVLDRNSSPARDLIRALSRACIDVEAKHSDLQGLRFEDVAYPFTVNKKTEVSARAEHNYLALMLGMNEIAAHIASKVSTSGKIKALTEAQAANFGEAGKLFAKIEEYFVYWSDGGNGGSKISQRTFYHGFLEKFCSNTK